MSVEGNKPDTKFKSPYVYPVKTYIKVNEIVIPALTISTSIGVLTLRKEKVSYLITPAVTIDYGDE